MPETLQKYESIAYATEGEVAVVTLNRPIRRNALSLELMLELIDCLKGIEKDPAMRVVVLAAEGKVFSSGHDLSEMVGRDINEYRRTFEVCTELMTLIQSLPQPVIAQVQGMKRRRGAKAAVVQLFSQRNGVAREIITDLRSRVPRRRHFV